MFPQLDLDKNGGVPVYRQLIEKITLLVKQGVLQAGDRLPPERELAESLGIARGTVKKAYGELARSLVIEMSQGRGSFVSFRQNVMEEGRKERAVRLIEDLVVALEHLRFSYREIRNLVEIKLLEREERRERFHLAVIDCNPEALSIFQKQLSFIAPLHLTRILLDELTADTAPERRLKDFDLIVTTATHYSEVLGMVPGLREKLLQVVLSPGQESIISLAALRTGQRIGILCESRQFLAIIRNKLKDFGIPAASVSARLAGPGEDATALLSEVDALIVPPNYDLGVSKENKAAVQAYTARGGRIIPFDYQVERGSLLYLEERIKEVLER